MERISKTNGLSDIGFNAIKYDSAHGKLIIAYDNSNVDLWSPDETVNIPDIKRKSIVGDKTIYSISINENLAYLSCGFGIVVLDLDKQEVKDTYYIGPEGTALKVNATAAAYGKLFAATDDGMYTADLDNPFLANYTSWQRWDSAALPVAAYQYLLSTPIGVYAASFNLVFRYNGAVWDSVIEQPGTYYNSMRYYNNALYLCEYNPWLYSRIHAIGPDDSTVAIIPQNEFVGSAKDVVVEDNGRMWVADFEKGMSRWAPGWIQTLYPTGPYSNGAFRIDTRNGDLYVASGSMLSSGIAYNGDGFFVYENDTWKTFNHETKPELTDSLLDFVSIVHNDKTGKTYAGSFSGGSGGGGLVERTNDQLKIYKQGYLLNIPAFATNYPVSDVAVDNDGNVWLTNNGTVKPLDVLTPAGDWQAFALQGISNTEGVTDVYPDNFGKVWVNVRNNGLYVYDPGEDLANTSDDQYKRYLTGSGQGNLPSNLMLDMVFDKNDDAWIGTDKGIAVVYCVSGAIEGCDAQQIIVSGSDSIAGYLLETERINAIAVDPGNRKWVGSENGVWLLSADGLEEIYHFTVDNSPLFSNSIQDIAVDGTTGLVYIATARGLLAFQSDATDVNVSDKRCEASVFPNPVKHDYSGPIAIRGVPYNATVKITDAAGGLVYQTKASGGTATWSGFDYNGNRAATGVYYATSVSADGQTMCRAKIIFIN